MAGLTEVVASVAASALTALVPVVASRLQTRRDAMLRASIVSNLEIVALLHRANDGAVEAGWLTVHVQSQIAALIGREQKQINRRRDWGTLYVTLGLSVPAGLLLYWMWKPLHWWSWIAFTLLAIVTVTLVFGGIGATFFPTKETKTEVADAKNMEASVGKSDQLTAGDPLSPVPDL